MVTDNTLEWESVFKIRYVREGREGKGGNSSRARGVCAIGVGRRGKRIAEYDPGEGGRFEGK